MIKNRITTANPGRKNLVVEPRIRFYDHEGNFTEMTTPQRYPIRYCITWSQGRYGQEFLRLLRDWVKSGCGPVPDYIAKELVVDKEGNIEWRN